VNKDLLDVLSKEELKRQELIFELIDTEEKYVKDLHFVVNVGTALPTLVLFQSFFFEKKKKKKKPFSLRISSYP